MANSNNQEIEVRFLEIDSDQLKSKLRDLGADDLGEELFKEIIFSDQAGEWPARQARARLRISKKGVFLAYKEHHQDSATGTTEIEFEVGDAAKCAAFLQKLQLVPVREQEKKRHTFQLGEVTVDIDTWPQVPPYVELEGLSEESLQQTAKRLGLEWNKVIFENAQRVIEKYYKIPIGTYKYFTFTRVGND